MDYSSLQMRIAFADTVYNKTGIDPVGLAMYSATGHGDAHSQTGFATFCESIGKRVFIIHDDITNKDWRIPEDVKVKTNRGEILVQDLKTTDTIEGLV
jgi:hypothetical protein